MLIDYQLHLADVEVERQSIRAKAHALPCHVAELARERMMQLWTALEKVTTS